MIWTNNSRDHIEFAREGWNDLINDLVHLCFQTEWLNESDDLRAFAELGELVEEYIGEVYNPMYFERADFDVKNFKKWCDLQNGQ
jgi:hypothetical protein